MQPQTHSARPIAENERNMKNEGVLTTKWGSQKRLPKMESSTISFNFFLWKILTPILVGHQIGSRNNPLFQNLSRFLMFFFFCPQATQHMQPITRHFVLKLLHICFKLANLRYSSFRGGLCSIGRVAHFNGRSICFSTSLQIFVGKIAGPLLEPFRDPKSGPARNHKQKLYIYFCGAISGAVKRTHFWAHLLARLLL